MLQFLNKIVFFSEEHFFILTNSADPNEVPHYAAFNVGLLCLKLKLLINYA